MLSMRTLRDLVVVTLAVVFVVVLASHPEAQQPITVLLSNGNTAANGLEAQRAASLANFTVSTTLTARNVAGVQLMVKPASWTVVSFPAANAQATASIAAEAAVRHVVDCVTWAADAAAAVVAAEGNLAVRDGATGAGTVIWQVAVAHLVAAGAGIQTIAPSTVCGLNLVGTTNTAMTAELNAGVTGEHQSVSMSGFNLQ